LTIQKRRKFFAELCKDFNPSRAAAAIGVHRKAIDEMLERDEGFRAKYDEIERAILDQAASVNILLSQAASREGLTASFCSNPGIRYTKKSPKFKLPCRLTLSKRLVNSIHSPPEFPPKNNLNTVQSLPGSENDSL